jgi:hypothetical protein
MIALGLLILAAAGVVGVAGVLANDGASHELARSFDVLGYEFTGASGVLFLIGIVVGLVGAVGLAMVLSGLRHRARRSLGARRARKGAKSETKALVEERDELAEALEAERRERERSAAPSITEADRGIDAPERAPQRAVPPSHSPAAPAPADSSPVPASYWQRTGKMPPPSNTS